MSRQRPTVNLCGCGCGALVASTFKRGHGMKVKENAEAHAKVMREKELKGLAHHSWKGGMVSRENGRVSIRVGTSYQLRSHIVMEKELGRRLTEDEVVHHVNEDPSDDRPENLVVLSRPAHIRLHKLGKKMSPEFCAHVSEAKRGKHVGKGNPMWGRTQSEETKRKISEAKKGRPLTLEHRQLLSSVQKGKKRTEETCRRISLTKIGRKKVNGKMVYPQALVVE